MAKVCGRLHDVDGMLHEMTPEGFAELYRYDELEPIDPSYWGEVLLTCLTWGFSHIASQLGGRAVSPSRFDPRPKAPREKPKPASVAAQKAALARRFGVNHGCR